MVNSQELNKTISELEEQVKKFKSISELYAELSELKSDLLNLKEQNTDSSERLRSISESLDHKLVEYEKILTGFLTDNKAFHNELEHHINSKLEKHKSDIQVEIRNEGVQIQRGFENSLTLNFNNLQSRIQEIYSTERKQFIYIRVLLFLLIGICLGLGIMIYF